MNSVSRLMWLAALVTAVGISGVRAEQFSPVKNKKRASASAPKSSSASSKGASSGRLLDSFDAPDWNPANHEKCVISLASAQGKTGSALKINYDLRDSKQWVAISKTFDVPPLKGRALEFWVKGTGASNALEIKMVDEDGSNFGVKKTGLTKTNGWTKVVLNDADFVHWWGGDTVLQSVHDVQFAISAGDGGAGEVLLDDMRIVQAVASALPKGVLDDGESVTDWVPAYPDGASIRLANGAGMKGKAVAVTYSFPEGQWVALRKKVNSPFKPEETISFFVKGEGASNNFEFKVVDKDGSVFGKTINALTGSPEWQEIRLPISDLRYLWGGDPQLDMNNVQYLDLAVSGSGGNGKLFLDEIRLN